MATDVLHRAFRSMSELNDFMYAHGIDSADVVSIYADRQTGLHVLWYTGLPDATAPRVAYSAIANNQLGGTRIQVFIQVGAGEVAKTMGLYYRTTGAPAYTGPIGFERVGADVYRSWIEGSAVQTPSVDYYIVVTDATGNTTSKGNAGAPLQFTVI